MFNESELKAAAKTIMSMCTDYLMGGLSEDMFRRNLKLYADNANQENPDTNKEELEE